LTLRAAIIGCGYIGGAVSPAGVISHAGAVRALDGIDLVAASDPDAEARRRFAEAWHVDALYGDHREMLAAARADVVSICTPTALHVAVARDAINAGARALWLEKPIADTLAEVDALAQLAGERGVAVAVNYLRAWDAGCQRMVRSVASGDVGSVLAVRGTYTKGLLHNGAHLVQLLCAALGRPLRVASTAGHTERVAIDFAADVTADLVGLGDPGYSLHELDFVAAEGRWRMLSSGERIELRRPAPSASFPGFRVLERADLIENPGLDGCLVAALKDLVECIGTTRRPACGLAEGRLAMQIATAALESQSRGGRPVDLSVDEGRADGSSVSLNGASKQ